MKELLRLWTLFRPYRGWMLAGTLIALLTLIANVALMALAGWFITAMAVAGAAGIAINYFAPAALIRLSAIVRTAGRYTERLVNHEATFRLIAELRVWFYRHLEPLAPARLQQYHSGDLLSRIRADIDALDNLYIRVLVPAAVAAISAVLFSSFCCCTIHCWPCPGLPFCCSRAWFCRSGHKGAAGPRDVDSPTTRPSSARPSSTVSRVWPS